MKKRNNKNELDELGLEPVRICRGKPPIKEVDLEQLKRFCATWCTQKEICYFLNIDEETLTSRLKAAGYKSFSEFYDIYSSEGKMSLRRTQYKIAREGNATMAIWLGKQKLGQREDPFDIPIKLLGKAKKGQPRLEVVMNSLEQRETLTHKQALDEIKVYSSIKLANKMVEEQSKISIEEQKTLINKIDQILEKNEIDNTK